MSTPLGILYGVGVGPGDPELITLKAVKAIEAAAVVFAAGSSKNEHSLALDIARPYLRPGTPVERLSFPMTDDEAVKEAAWQDNARRVWAVVSEGRHAAFLTLGDPMTYSTFIYLWRTFRRVYPQAPPETVQVVPGVTSYAAAAAAARTPLAEGEESLLVVSGAAGGGRLAAHADLAENIVVLKTYRRFGEIREELGRLGLMGAAVMASQVGLPGQRLEPDLARLDATEKPSYFSLIIAKKHG